MPPLAKGPLIALRADGIEIPGGIQGLSDFRAWARSEEFPERGRIDWIEGRLEVDMSPEDLNTHGSPKSAIAIKIGSLLQEPGRAMVFIDRARYSCPDADLSVEPDVLVLLVETLERGRARLLPKVSGVEGRYVEIEGAVDLAVECLSDSSEEKDEGLREKYHRASVREYWLVDARKDEIDFQLLLYRPSGYLEAPRDGEGFARSEVLGGRVRLVRAREVAGLVFFRLEVKLGE